MTKKRKLADGSRKLVQPIPLDSSGRPVFPIVLGGLTVYSLGEVSVWLDSHVTALLSPWALLLLVTQAAFLLRQMVVQEINIKSATRQNVDKVKSLFFSDGSPDHHRQDAVPRRVCHLSSGLLQHSSLCQHEKPRPAVPLHLPNQGWGNRSTGTHTHTHTHTQLLSKSSLPIVRHHPLIFKCNNYLKER